MVKLRRRLNFWMDLNRQKKSSFIAQQVLLPDRFQSIRIIWRQETMKRHLSGSPSRPPHIVASSVVRSIAPRRWKALRMIAGRAKSLKRRLLQRDLFLRRLPPEAREVEAQTAIHTSYPVIMRLFLHPKKLSLSFIKKREFHSPIKVTLLLSIRTTTRSVVSFVTSETRFCIFFLHFVFYVFTFIFPSSLHRSNASAGRSCSRD